MLNHITQNVSALLSSPKGGWGIMLLLCIILLASCGTKKHAVATTPEIPTVTCVTARMNLMLSSGGKEITLGGMLRMKRDDVIQLTLVPFGILEVGRIEMTPDYFMILDKMNKQYVKAAYSDVSFLRKAKVDFRTIQAYFWNEHTPPLAEWVRTDYVNIEGWSFPTRHLITIANDNKSVQATLTLSNLKSDSGWETRTEVSSRYRERTVDEILSMIMNAH